MKQKPYKRKPGEFEIRILSDGRAIFVAPDEALVTIVRGIETDPAAGNERKEAVDHDRNHKTP